MPERLAHVPTTRGCRTSELPGWKYLCIPSTEKIHTRFRYPSRRERVVRWEEQIGETNLLPPYGDISMTTIKRVVAIMMFAVLVTVSAFAQTQQMDVSPSVMTFTYQMGSSFPPSQVLTITSSVPTTFTISAIDGGCGWLSTNQGNSFSGNTPLTLSISEHPSDGGLCAFLTGTRTGQVIIRGTKGVYSTSQ